MQVFDGNDVRPAGAVTQTPSEQVSEVAAAAAPDPPSPAPKGITRDKWCSCMIRWALNSRPTSSHSLSLSFNITRRTINGPSTALFPAPLPLPEVDVIRAKVRKQEKRSCHCFFVLTGGILLRKS